MTPPDLSPDLSRADLSPDLTPDALPQPSNDSLGSVASEGGATEAPVDN